MHHSHFKLVMVCQLGVRQVAYRIHVWQLSTSCFTSLFIFRSVVWCLTRFSTIFWLYRGSQWTYPYFPGVLLTSTPYNILFKQLTAFPHNHYWHNSQRWERKESCCKDYHLSSERILAEPGIEPATSYSQVSNATDWTMGLCSLFSDMTWSSAKFLSHFAGVCQRVVTHRFLVVPGADSNLCLFTFIGYIPNCPEAVIAMLAAASIGAVWSSTSPDFGVVVNYRFIFLTCIP